MKSLLLLLLAMSLAAQPLVLGTTFHPSEGESILLTSGVFTSALNDSGVTITLENGDLRARTLSENLFITLSDGIASVNGTVHITADEDSLKIMVFDGYMRFISSGGYPGETVTTGYVRTLSRETSLGERYLNTTYLRDQFCDINEDEQYNFNCISPVEEPIEVAEVIESPLTTVLFHEPTWLETESSSYSSSQFVSKIIELIQRDTISISPVLSTNTSYAQIWEMEKAGEPFRIIDIAILTSNSSSDEFTAEITLYQSETKISNKILLNGSFRTLLLAADTNELPFIKNFIHFIQDNIH